MLDGAKARKRLIRGSWGVSAAATAALTVVMSIGLPLGWILFGLIWTFYFVYISQRG